MKHTELLKKLPLYLAFTGVGIAILVVIFIQVQDGNLIVSGTILAKDFSVSRLLSALISMVGPFFIFIPFYALAKKEHLWSSLIRAWIAPWFLLLPVILVMMFKGSVPGLMIFTALIFMSLYIMNLTIWISVLKRVMSWPSLYLTWALLWMSTEFMSYLTYYLAPYIEDPFIKALSFGYWLLPPVTFTASSIAPILEGGNLHVPEMLKLGLQTGILLGVYLMINRVNPINHPSIHRKTQKNV